MEDIFNTKISVYRTVTDRIGQIASLGAFLFPRERHATMVENLRMLSSSADRKRAKESIPAATISGVFTPTRKVENLAEHSGFMCLDFDAKDNPMQTVGHMKRICASHPSVAYAGLSVSGMGCFAVLPMAYPSEHRSQFKALEAEFASLGLVIDKSCADVSRLRFLSHDAAPYVNRSAVRYRGLHAEASCQVPTTVCPTSGFTYPDEWKVSRCCQKIAAHGIDLTADYASWVKIGMSLSSMGEVGRQYFHVCSHQNADYRSDECDKKFDELLRNTKEVGLASFFWECQAYGITYRRDD